MTGLPPGQRAVRQFPRFGIDLDHPAPTMPDALSLTVTTPTGPLDSITPEALGELPRRVVRADFHCVAGWTATDLAWEGVRFSEVFRQLIEPALPAESRPRFVAFTGGDGYRSILHLEDALADDVLLADTLDGAPLTAEHGAPRRLVSPAQYGYMNTKHLTGIEVFPFRPVGYFHPAKSAQWALRAVHPHPRARVAREERHRFLPSRVARLLYRLFRIPAEYR